MPRDHLQRLAPRALVAVALAALLGAQMAPVAQAALSAVGPRDPRHGFPIWYEDANGVRLELCLRPAGRCLDPLPHRGAAAVPSNFPGETFWWATEAELSLPGGGRARLVLAQEAAFLTESARPGKQISFARVRVRADDVTPNAFYTFTHPFGVERVRADDRGRAKFTEDIGCVRAPCDFTRALEGRVGPFLRWAPSAPAPPRGYIGNPLVEHTIVGSPRGTNFFRISGPGIGILTTNRFSVQGKLAGPKCTIRGTAGNNTLEGTPHHDVICGLGGNDVIRAGKGRDVLVGSSGDDVLKGGAGRDTVDYSMARGVVVNLRRGRASGEGHDRLSNIANVRGSVRRDRIVGTPRPNLITGNSSSDRLLGGGGSDRLLGGPQGDVLAGGRGNDRVSGNSGRDQIRGGKGSDRLLGGADGDRIKARDHRRDRVAGGSGRDRARVDSLDRLRAVERVS